MQPSAFEPDEPASTQLDAEIVVVPTRAHVDAETSARLARAERGIVVAPAIVSLGTLTDGVAESTGTSARQIDPLASLAIHRAAARSLASSWGLSPTTVARWLMDTRRRLARAGLGADDLAASARGIESTSTRERAEVVARALTEVELRLSSSSGIDEPDVLAVATRALQSGGSLPNRWARASMVVSDVHDLSPSRMTFLDALASSLARRRGSLRVELPHRENAPWFRFTRRLLDALERRGELGAEVMPVDPVSIGIELGRGGAAIVRAVEPGPMAIDVRESARDVLRTWVAADRAGEIAVVARAVADALHGGTPPDRVMIAMPDPARYAAAIREALEALDVPVTDRRGAPVLASPVVRTLLETLETSANGWDAARILTIAARGHVTPPCDAPALRRWFRAAGARDDAGDEATGGVLRALTRYADHLDTDGQSARAIEVREATVLLAPWLDALRPPTADTTLADVPSRVRALVAHLGIDRDVQARLGAAIRRDVGAPRDSHVAHDHAALGALLDAVERLPTAGAGLPLGHERLSWREVATLVAASVVGETCPSFVAPAGGVRLLDLREAAGLSADTVVIVGLEDGSLPARRADDPLLPRRELAAVLRALRTQRGPTFGLDWLALAHDHPDAEDELLVARTLVGAERRVVLTRAATDTRGRPVSPSRLWSALAAGVARHDIAHASRAFPPRPVPTLGDALGERDSRRALAYARSRGAPSADGRLASIVEDAVTRARVERARRRAMRQGVALDAWSGAVGTVDPTSPIGRALRGVACRDRPLSVTALERTAQCAFKDLVTRVLRVTEPEEVEGDMSARLAGSLAHACIQAALSRLDREADPHVAGAEKAAERAARRVVARWAAERPVGDATLFEIRARRIVEQVVTAAIDLMRARAEGTTWLIEHPFGERDAAWPAVEVPVADDVAHLRGRIDLVELGATTVRVTDFKGAARSALRKKLRRDALLETDLQLPLYAAAARRATGLVDVDARAWSLRDAVPVESLGQIVRGEGRTAAAREWADVGTTLDDVTSVAADRALGRSVATLLTSMRAGRFPVAPRNEACARCGLGAVCRVPELLDEEDDGL